MRERRSALLMAPEKRPARSARLVAAAIRGEHDMTRATAGRMNPAGPRASDGASGGVTRAREGLPRR